MQVEVEGQAAQAANSSSISSVGLGAFAALIVLLVVFGSLLAATLPLITAGVALGAGTATIGLLSHVINMASFSSQLSLLIGLGVGVDYALFIVTRYRQGLQRGKSVSDAIVDAIDTSGRAAAQLTTDRLVQPIVGRLYGPRRNPCGLLRHVPRLPGRDRPRA